MKTEKATITAMTTEEKKLYNKEGAGLQKIYELLEEIVERIKALETKTGII